jgi:hypothetical protein
MPKLIVQLQGQEWTAELQPGSNILGRASQCSVPLKDPSLSRQHCEIVLNGSVARLVDKGSMNGTLLNGKRTVEQDLQPGDKIAIGACVIWYERKNVAAERKVPTAAVRPTAPPDPSATSQAATRRTLAAAVQTATPPPGPALIDARAQAADGLRDYTFRGGAGGGWVKTALLLLVLAGLGVGAYLGRGLLSSGGDVVAESDNLIARNPTFNGAAGGKPDGWTVAASRGEGRGDKAASTAGIDPTQGRNGSACLVLEKSTSPGDLLVECAYADEFGLGSSGAVKARAWTRFAGFGGWAALKVDWLQRPKGAVVAEEYSDPVTGCEGWTQLEAVFPRPPGAAAFRISLAAGGRGGRLFFDDVYARTQPGSGAAAHQPLGAGRFAHTRHGVLQMELPGRRPVLDALIRLESEKEGAMLQPFAGEGAMEAVEGGFIFRGRMLNPVSLKDAEYEVRLAAQDTLSRLVWQFTGNSLQQVDRVTVLLTLSRGDRLLGLPEPNDQPVDRIIVSGEEGDLVLEYGEPARVRARTVDGRLRLSQTFAVDPTREDPAFVVLFKPAAVGTGAVDPLEAAKKARGAGRPGEAVSLLRLHVRTLKEAAQKDKVETEIRQLDDLEARDWGDAQARAFQAQVSRRSEVVKQAYAAIDQYVKQWAGAGGERKAAMLREDLAKELEAAPDPEAEGPARILERARKCVESGRKALARAMLQTLIQKHPQSAVVEEARALLRTVAQ